MGNLIQANAEIMSMRESLETAYQIYQLVLWAGNYSRKYATFSQKRYET